MIYSYSPSVSGRVNQFLKQEKESLLPAYLKRLGFLILCFAFLFSVLIARLGWVMLGGGQATSGCTSDCYGIDRGDILDRNGEVLATNLTTFSLFANAKIVRDPEQAARQLCQLFPDLHKTKILAQLRSGKNFVWLKRNLTPQDQRKVNELGIIGLDFKKEQKRIYPHGSIAAHVVGYTSVDNKGLGGIENSLNTALSQKNAPVRLALDLRVQHILHEAIKQGMKTYNAQKGNGILMKTNGEVVAMVSLPDFDPHRPNPKKDEIFNANTLGVYELGSIFKLFSFAMGLESGKVSLSESINAEKPLKIGRHIIRDYYAKNKWLSVPEVFMYSSNIGVVTLALRVGLEEQKAFFQKLGFFGPLETELAENAFPLVPKRWSAITLATISYGYGLALTPLQFLGGVVSMLNGGFLTKPTFLLGGNAEKPLTRVVSSQTSEALRRLMRLVVKQGSGRRADVPGYLVGGKSGSANKLSTSGRGYVSKNKHRASFLFAFPITKPQYIGLVTLDEPKGNAETRGFSTGGVVAAPIARQIIQESAPLLNVSPVDESAPHIQVALKVQEPTEKAVSHGL